MNQRGVLQQQLPEVFKRSSDVATRNLIFESRPWRARTFPEQPRTPGYGPSATNLKVLLCQPPNIRIS